ncbi:MAG TPA: HAMP domain-containing sensor histidine kinase [Polyangia bacterium]|jgi:signal transduction histidine kinase
MSSGKNDPAAQPVRRRRFSSLALRLGVWYTGTLLVAVAVLGALALYALRHEAGQVGDLVVHERLERHREVLGRVGLPEFERAITHATELEGERGPVRVEDGAGRILFSHGDMAAASTVVSTSLTSDLRLQVASTDDPWKRIASPLKVAGLFVLVGWLLIAIAGGALLTGRALRPVAALASTARAVIQSGDLSRRVDVRDAGRGELDDLALLFNRMLERNQLLVRNMSESLDNVAHDLRTPLTRLRGVAEVALRSNEAGQASEALADCIEESDRVLVMLRTLMDISEAEAGIMKLQIAPVDLRAIAGETLELYEQVADDAGVSLSLRPGAPVTAPADATRLRQALANLVDNAVKYTGRGGHVEIEVDADEQEASVRVRDDGVGIPAPAIPRIWDRLFRVDPSRAEHGLGLGLSLVKAIALAHQGRVKVESAPGRGSVFALSLPLSDERPGTGKAPA